MSAPADFVLKGGLTQGLATTAVTIKNAALWLGKTVKVGFEKLIEAITKAWSVVAPFVKEAATKIWQGLKMPLIQAITAGVISTVFATVAETVNTSKWTKLALRIVSLAFAALCGAAVTLGVVFGFMKPLGA